MGFYATDERAAVLESCQENPVPPSKNRVWNFFTASGTCAGFFESQPVEPHQEKWPTPTTTASGVRYYGYRQYSPEMGKWLSRDPIGERGGNNLHGFCRNDPVCIIDVNGNIYVMQALLGSLQVASGLMMWTVAIPAEVGTVGVATPVAVGLAAWGTFSIANGINMVQSAIQNQGPEDAYQVQAVSLAYETIWSHPMPPSYLAYTRLGYYAVDIAACGYSVNATWSTAQQTGVLLQTTTIETYQTSQLIQVQKVTSHLEFNVHLANSPTYFWAGYDYYSLLQDVRDVTGVIINFPDVPAPPNTPINIPMPGPTSPVW